MKVVFNQKTLFFSLKIDDEKLVDTKGRRGTAWVILQEPGLFIVAKATLELAGHGRLVSH